MLAAPAREIVLAMDDEKVLAEEEMKIVLGPQGTLRRINKAIDPAAAVGEYIGVTRIEPAAAAGLADATRGDLAPGHDALLRRRVSRNTPTVAASSTWPPSARCCRGSRVDNHADLARAREIACQLLARMVGVTPDGRRPAGARSRGSTGCSPTAGISSGGKVVVLVGPGQGEEIARVLEPRPWSTRTVLPVRSASIENARELAATLRESSYDASRRHRRRGARSTSRSTSPPWSRCPWSPSPRTCRTTASPHRSRRWSTDGRKGSYGVHIPLGRLRRPRLRPACTRADGAVPGIGDVVSKPVRLCRTGGWRRPNAVSPWTVSRGRVGPGCRPEAVLYRTDTIDSTDFLTTLSEALVLSGLAMARRREQAGPAAAGDHEILQRRSTSCSPAVSKPRRSSRGVGALFCAFPSRRRSSASRARRLPCGGTSCPADPRTSGCRPSSSPVRSSAPRPLGRTATRSLEHLDLDADEVGKRVDSFSAGADAPDRRGPPPQQPTLAGVSPLREQLDAAVRRSVAGRTAAGRSAR